MLSAVSKVLLPTVTMVALTDSDVGKTVEALLKSLEHITPIRTILFSNVQVDNPNFECKIIPPFGSARKYNEFVTWKLGSYVEDGHILLVQHDGYVIDGSAWTDEFLKYDYIGAPWNYTDGRNVGNGGFSLRSSRLHHILATDPDIKDGSPEDEIICRLYRHLLERKHGLVWAPEPLAHQFSFEMHRPLQKTFGFHNHFHQPYKEPIILQRWQGGMGDMIMLETVMAWYHEHGYRVILDCQPQYHELFVEHFYPIEHAHKLREDTRGYRKINLDMAYEVKPEQLVLKSYFEACGIKDYPLRNPQLNFGQKGMRLFDKYAVLHINQTDMPYRNIVMDGWWKVAALLDANGYTVVKIGEHGPSIAPTINASNNWMLGHIVGGADIFIGSDSGPSHIAAACGVPSIIMFGSVNPLFRHYDLSKIHPIVMPCSFPSCYHKTIGTRGSECVIDLKEPPCSKYDDKLILRKIKEIINHDT